MLALKNITKIYAEKTDNAVNALKGINLAFRNKEFVSILGQSGCGKTTLLNIIGGLDRYTDGDLVINGTSTKEYKGKDWDTYRNHSIGFVFQSYNLIPHQTILENVELSMTLGGVEYNDRKRRAKDVLVRLGLGDKLNKKPNQLSGGQCQRVAIARAIVNEPDIILADEPTGALDSETSVTIMDILKEISKEKLVIMVTHNPELAEKYSDRIIKMFDGVVKDDSKPYSFEEEEADNNEAKSQAVDQIVYKKKHSSMNFLTALRLSGMNLLSKFRRTLITSIAASIGIIGIAVILSVSNGMQDYIDNSMNDIASSNRVLIESNGLNYEALMDESSYEGMMNNGMIKYPDEKEIYPYEESDMTSRFLTTQEISNNFVEYLNQVTTDKVIDISYSYGVTLNKITKIENGTDVEYYSPNLETTGFSLMGSSEVWEQSISNIEYLNMYYDTIYAIDNRTSGVPTSTNNSQYYEAAIVVDKYNRLTCSTLDALGIYYSQTTVDEQTTYGAIDITTLVGKEYKIILNNEWYTPNNTDESQITKFTTPENTPDNLETLYNNTNNITVKIVGVLRLKEEADASMLSTGFVYHPSLIDKVMEINSESTIVKLQKADKILNYTTGRNFNKGEEDTKSQESLLRKLGGKNNPSSITIYPTTINAKDEIIQSINEWNNNHNDDKVEYTDVSKLLTSVLGEMVNITTYVLMAFSITSLVISSIMIAIIIYASVIERTKEIGVLRSIGARKKDVSRVFQAEAVILGAISGIIAIIITIVLDIIINIILVKVAGVDNIARLKPLTGFLLVCLSVFLLLIASLIPASMAAKKEPAIALRTE